MTDEKLLTVLSDDIPEDLKRQRIRASWAMAECRVRDAERLSVGTHSYMRLNRKTWVLHRKGVPEPACASPSGGAALHHANGSRITVEQWRDGKCVAVFSTLTQAAKATGMPLTSIRKRLHGIVDPDTPTADGSLWRKHVEGAGI